MSLERLVPGTEGWDRYHADHVQRYNFFASRYSGKTVLDMACGAGYGSNLIASHGASKVTGIDIAPEAVSFAKQNYKDSRLEFLQMDFREIEKSNKNFDLVISFETIEHVADPAEFLRVAASVLKPGGKCIVSTPNKKKSSDAGLVNPFHLSELYYEDFKKIFSTHFSIDSEYHQTESVNYRRWQYLKWQLDSVKTNFDRLPFNAFKRFVKNLVGKDPVPPEFADISYAHPEDFVLEPMSVYNDRYSVIILEGTRR